MKKRSQGDFSSLDLLLDTICNTFGGIVFLALLLSILAQSAGRVSQDTNTPGDDNASNILAESRIALLRKEIDDLRSRLAEEESTLRETSDNPRVEELKQATRERMEILDDVREGQAKLTSLQTEILKLSRAKTDSVRDEATMRKEAEKMVRDASVPRRLPVIQDAPRGMTHFWVAIHAKRFYLVTDLPSLSTYPGSYHSDVVFEEKENPDREEVTLREGRGIPIDQNGEAGATLRAMLSEISPDRAVIQFMVSPDSFAEFNLLKERLVGQGYRYFLRIGTPPYIFVQGTPKHSF
jgi:hypothetical protein